VAGNSLAAGAENLSSLASVDGRAIRSFSG